MNSTESILAEYEEFVEKTSALKTNDTNYLWWALSGLASEAGEALAEQEKAIRKGRQVDTIKLDRELGDTLWYLVAILIYRGIFIEQLMEMNMDKLIERAKEQNAQA